MLLPTLGAAQMQSQLDEKYPKVNAYLVRPKILLTARYSTGGLVCEMVLQPVRWTGDTILLFPMSEEETIHVVEEIVPESERGKKLDAVFSRITGHGVETTYRYEKITVNFAGTTDKGGADLVAVVTWRDRSCK